MTNMKELKPCPFCGGTASIEESEPSTARFNEGSVHFKASCPPVVGEYISSCVGSQLITGISLQRTRLIDGIKGQTALY